MTPFRVRSVFSFAALLAAVGCGGGGGNGVPADAAKSLDERVRVNQIQVRGTHNSYHVQPVIPFDASHCYTHAPLDVQLEDQGVRAFELDVHWSAGAGEVEVYHLGLIDQQTTCKRLRDCLGTIDAWSDGRPTHLPIFVWIEVKDQYGGQRFANLDPVDAAFRDAFGAKLLTPDEVQGDAATLREAIETRGWPTLAEARGRVLAILLNGDDHTRRYTEDFTTLAGKAMFANAEADQFGLAWAAASKINDPGDPLLAEALEAGLLAASNTCAANNSDATCYAEVEAGLASGTHMFMDDIPAPISGREYFLDFPGGALARCNPVAGGDACEPGEPIGEP